MWSAVSVVFDDMLERRRGNVHLALYGLFHGLLPKRRVAGRALPHSFLFTL